jgi:hypothetical protein
VATGLATLGLVAVGAALVWLAWQGSQRGGPGRQASASAVGLTGGVCVLCGVAVGVSGLASPPGAVAVVVAAVVLVAGLATAGIQARRAT